MPANFQPIFPLTGISSAVAVPLITDVAAGTGSATLFTAGAFGTKWDGVQFMPTAQIGGSGWLHIYYNTNLLVGTIAIPDPWELGRPVLWKNPAANHVVTATYVIKVGKIGQAGVIHAFALATDY